MCMKNVNAVVDIDKINDNNEIVTELDKDGNKVIPINQNDTVKLYFQFLSTIINGKDDFFKKCGKLYFQLRFTDNTVRELCNFDDFEIDLKTQVNNYYKTDYVDFMTYNNAFFYDMDCGKLGINETKKYYIAVLIKTQRDVDEGRGWTVQSITPTTFKKF